MNLPVCRSSSKQKWGARQPTPQDDRFGPQIQVGAFGQGLRFRDSAPPERDELSMASVRGVPEDLWQSSACLDAASIESEDS
ncbi:MAG: hypothetical protein AB9869_01975 [Verrucomicrobiia bacterium]